MGTVIHENNISPTPPSASVASAQQGSQVPGVLVFIIADMVVFCMLFTGFMIERRDKFTVFDASAATLDVRMGVLNTLILVTSGLFVALQQ